MGCSFPGSGASRGAGEQQQQQHEGSLGRQGDNSFYYLTEANGAPAMTSLGPLGCGRSAVRQTDRYRAGSRSAPGRLAWVRAAALLQLPLGLQKKLNESVHLCRRLTNGVVVVVVLLL